MMPKFSFLPKAVFKLRWRVQTASSAWWRGPGLPIMTIPTSGIQGYMQPICYNALAVRSQVSATIKRTQAAMAGGSQAQVEAAIDAAIKSGELHTAEAGSMAYMLSKEAYLSNRVRHWRPHLMLFTPETDPKSWGAGLPDSPILGIKYPEEHLTVFLIPVGRWSDGTPSVLEEH